MWNICLFSNELGFFQSAEQKRMKGQWFIIRKKVNYQLSLSGVTKIRCHPSATITVHSLFDASWQIGGIALPPLSVQMLITHYSIVSVVCNSSSDKRLYRWEKDRTKERLRGDGDTAVTILLSGQKVIRHVRSGYLKYWYKWLFSF